MDLQFFQFFKPKTSRLYHTTRWDARLFSALMKDRWNPALKIPALKIRDDRRNKLNVATLLEHRQTKMESNVPVHKYTGYFRIWLDDESQEYCDIPVEISFAEPHEDYDCFINDFDLGYFYFDHILLSNSGGRPSPAFSLTLKDRAGLSEAVAKLFADTRAMGSKDIRIYWSIDLKTLEGLTATQAWGDWSVEAIYDDDGNRINEWPPGCGSFPIESLSFEAEVL